MKSGGVVGVRGLGELPGRERTVETDIMYEYRYCAIILNSSTNVLICDIGLNYRHFLLSTDEERLEQVSKYIGTSLSMRTPLN